MCQIQCSELTAERHRLQEQLRLMGEQHQRTSSSQQLSLKALQDECSAAKVLQISCVLLLISHLNTVRWFSVVLLIPAYRLKLRQSDVFHGFSIAVVVF